jgi:quinol monooxygenase YgiN
MSLVSVLADFLYWTGRSKSDSMGQYGFFVKFKTLEGKREELVSILLQASQFVATLNACRQYIVYRDAKDENLVYVHEIWDTKEDHDKSLANQASRELIPKAMSLLDGKPEGTELELAGGISTFRL